MGYLSEKVKSSFSSFGGKFRRGIGAMSLSCRCHVTYTLLFSSVSLCVFLVVAPSTPAYSGQMIRSKPSAHQCYRHGAQARQCSDSNTRRPVPRILPPKTECLLVHLTFQLFSYCCSVRATQYPIRRHSTRTAFRNVPPVWVTRKTRPSVRALALYPTSAHPSLCLSCLIATSSSH